jgi:hypothetical protein
MNLIHFDGVKTNKRKKKVIENYKIKKCKNNIRILCDHPGCKFTIRFATTSKEDGTIDSIKFDASERKYHNAPLH